MKFTDQADIDDYKKAIQIGMLKGIGYGAVVSVGLTALLRRRTTFFHNAGGLQKVLVYVTPSVFGGITLAEGASRSFEDHQRRKQHGLSDDAGKHKDANTYDAMVDFFGRHKYKFVTAGWAASLGGSFYLVNRDPYMTKAQKIVQARVYAQGLTVVMLLATVFLSVGGNKSAADIEKERKTTASQSWQRDLDFVESANRTKGLVQRATEKATGAGDKSEKSSTDAELQEKKQSGDVGSSPAAKAPEPAPAQEKRPEPVSN